MQQVLCELCGKDERNVYYFPLDESKFEGYRQLITRPLSLATISTKVTLFTTEETPAHLKYSWQNLEDDVVTLLQNSVMFNKYHSEYGALALRLLGDLPALFVDEEGEMCYSRSTSKSNAAITLSKGKATVGNKRSREETENNNNSSNVVGDLFAYADTNQLQQEAKMLNFLALWKKEASSLLVSTLLTAPFAPKPSSQVTSHIPANHQIPCSVAELEVQVIQHKITTFSSFVRTIDMMVALAVGATIDTEAVKILISFKANLQQLLQQQPTNDLLVSHNLIDERLLNVFIPFVAAYQPTFTSTPGVTSHTLADLKAKLRQHFPNNYWLLKILESAPSDSPPEAEPHSSTLVVERVLQTLKVADYLGKQDSNQIFKYPFLSQSYMDKCVTPIDFFTMKMKAIVGLYFFQTARVTQHPDSNKSFEEAVGMDIAPSSVKTGLRTDLDFMVDNSVAFNGPDHVASLLSTSLRKQLNEIASTKAGIAAY